ncbi:hypothetical protein KEJ27_10340, partial [Candidatus Bathyarchaeota archaeon]|nr:hypothetical protein [Candidatus Bathyarchaeota archaeon]
MKSSISLRILTPLLALLILLAAPAYAAVVTITVTTDKPSYLLGQIVTISGTVKEDNVAKANVYVNVEVRDPVGTLRFADVVKTASDGSYTTSFKLAETLATGTYTVKATYGGVSETASFTVSAAPTFTMTVTPETLVVPIGLSDSTNIQVTAVGAYVYKVALTATTVENLSVSFINATGTPSFSSIAVVTAPLEAAKGTYRLTVTATGEDNTTVSKSLTVVVVDTPPAISKLLSELESINETLTGLEKTLTGLENTVKDLKTDVDTVKTSVTGLTSRLLTAETNIDSLLS